MLWLEQVDLVGKGDLVTLTKKDKKFPFLIDDQGNWTVRNDVYFQEIRFIEGGTVLPAPARMETLASWTTTTRSSTPLYDRTSYQDCSGR